MRATGLLAAVTLAGFTASQAPSLRVLRVTPTDPADPTDAVTVTFDRPVAGQLDGTVDPKTLFSISPAVPGQVEWRDPITLRFTPDAPLTPNTSYSVTVANTFTAMDGGRLDQPHRFTFRVGGPRVLTGSPAGPGLHPLYLRPNAAFELLTSTPVDLEDVGRLVHLELDNNCQAGATAPLRAIAQRPLAQGDPPRYRYAGGYYRRDPRRDPHRRVVRLALEHPLAAGCSGFLVTPGVLDATSTAPAQRWPFAIYGAFRLNGMTCTAGGGCPAGWAQVSFSTPVRGSEVQRAISLTPATRFVVDDTSRESAVWALQASLRTRTRYTITADPSLRDVFGQNLTGKQTDTIATGGYTPALEYASGRMLVERASNRTLAVRHVNVDTLFVTTVAIPDSLEARILSTPDWNIAQIWPLLAPLATVRAIAVAVPQDVPQMSAVRLPTYNAAATGSPTLTAVRISRTRPRARQDTVARYRGDIALVQVTDLGIAGRIGLEEAAVWVTTVHDGQAAAGATVTLYNSTGRVRATGITDAEGLVRLTGLAPDTAATPGGDEDEEGGGTSGGYLAATLGNDRAVVAVDANSWELSPWRFNIWEAYGNQKLAAAAAVFTERGIYRPGEMVHAKAIVRTGTLGSLRVPARTDSLHWVFYDREQGVLRDTTVAGSAWGTAEQTLAIPADRSLGTYRLTVALKRGGKWAELGYAYYRVAEYRPPEFLVTIEADSARRFNGDSLSATVEARYLFGAPMGRAEVQWVARRLFASPWELNIPNTDGYQLGESGWWWEERDDGNRVETLANGTDTLDGGGHLRLKVGVGAANRGRASRVIVEATVTDVNRQTVSSTTSAVVHPGAFYLGAKGAGDDYFWRAGTPQEISVIAVRPDGRRVPDVAVRGTIVRREWHRVQRSRDGLDEQVGEWVSDTVATCTLTTTADPAPCRFTPALGGSYIVSFKARDAAGRQISTSFFRWAIGRGWVPWGDETQFRMDVIPDKVRYDVGDTATVLFASPFTDAEAWVTVEREGLIMQRRVRITAGATSMKIPLTEAFVPNAFVSIVVARGRSAPPGGIADPGRPTIRVGYAELKVVPRIKRLEVQVQPLATEYRPGDTARVRIRIRDAAGTGRRGEVTLWAVDEGVLALTGYRTPDPVELIYSPRGVGMRLVSDLIAVAPQLADSEGVSIKGDRAPGGGGGLEGGDILRSRFSSTAFFLGSVVTDERGEATASAKLPDNLTTFRVMAVAVTTNDRYGSGQSNILVTRPLLARPALPRFLRRDDRVIAGVVVNQRAGGTPTVTVRARTQGVTMAEASTRTATLMAGRGTEVRFSFRDTTSDSTAFRFDVTDGHDSDAVLVRLPVKPSHTPRAYTAAGVVQLTATTEITLPADIDPERSSLTFDIGTTPLALIGGMYRQLRIYPFDCSEQITSAVLPIIALYRAGAAPGGQRYAPAGAEQQIIRAVRILTERQRTDGGIGLWAANDWSSAWLSSHAGHALLAAKAAGIPVNDSVLARLGDYVYRSIHQRSQLVASPIAWWLQQLQVRLAEDVAAVDFLSRLGRTDLPGENDLVRNAPQMAWEDRVRLAEVIARRRALDGARRILAPIWAGVRIEGRRAVMPDSARRSFYFWSDRRPTARLLAATLAVDPAHPLIGPLVETLVDEGRAALRSWWWNTQDYGTAVMALSELALRQQRAVQRGFTVAALGQVAFRSQGQGDVIRDWTRNLTGLLTANPDGSKKLALTIAAPAAEDAAPLYYYVTVQEVPRVRPLTPDQQGIQVERWYESFVTGRPIISAPEGSLVRVRLRIRIPAERRFVALTDPLPAGLEAVDLSLRTSGGIGGPGAGRSTSDNESGETEEQDANDEGYRYGWYFGYWDSGWWSPFDHREMRDDRVSWFATYLWPGTYTASYIARATTPGIFIRPPAHAEEMYNPAVQGRSDGGVFTVTRRAAGR